VELGGNAGGMEGFASTDVCRWRTRGGDGVEGSTGVSGVILGGRGLL
jgi:hypothetical protein